MLSTGVHQKKKKKKNALNCGLKPLILVWGLGGMILDVPKWAYENAELSHCSARTYYYYEQRNQLATNFIYQKKKKKKKKKARKHMEEAASHRS